jgi:hypothetical protein
VNAVCASAPTTCTRIGRGAIAAEQLIFATYFNAGLRVYDLTDAASPTEIAHWIPACPPGQLTAQTNDVLVDEDHIVYVTDRINGGIYILEPEDWLDRRMSESSRRRTEPEGLNVESGC